MNVRQLQLQPSTHFHLIYLTANDQRNFSIDYLNFRNMALRNPGVTRLEITIAISRVRPFTKANRKEVDALVRCASASSWLHVRSVIWKGNLGRDFSSAEAGLKSLDGHVADDDYVMIRNRSAYGPFSDGWYRSYVDQYGQHPHTGLVGNTINLVGPPTQQEGTDGRHVQTYVYLSQWKYLAPLANDFPGNRCTDNPGAILHGEVGLSRKFMAAGMNISCLYWPEHAFGSATPDDQSLPHFDIKSEVEGLPFRYKFPNYRRNPASMWRRIVWVTSARWLFHFGRTPPVRHLHVANYG
jgi:hypothetical protein